MNKNNSEERKLTKEEQDFIGVSQSSIMYNTAPWAYVIITIIVIFIISALVWMSFAELDETITANARIMPASDVQIIDSLDGGIVKKILVETGDMVKKSQVLLEIDNTRYQAAYSELESQRYYLMAKIARLKAQVNNDKQISFPKELYQPEHELLIKRETALFNTNRHALEQSLKKLQGELNAILKELNIVRELAKDGHASRVHQYRLERIMHKTQREINEKKDSYMSESYDQLNEAQAKLASLKESITQRYDRVKQSIVRSPTTGIVKFVHVHTVGGVINPGEKIFEIVPISDKLVVRAEITPQNIAFIKVGQPAKVRISAYDFTRYGSLNGKVIKIGADAISKDADPRSDADIGQAYSYYEAFIRTDKSYLMIRDQQYPIIPGMMASVSIVTGKKTVLAYILKPILKARYTALQER